VAQLAGRGLKASAHTADIREPDAVNALFCDHDLGCAWPSRQPDQQRRRTISASRGIDFSVKGWNAVINTNLNGLVHDCRPPRSAGSDHKHPGSIVNIVVVTTHGLYGIAPHHCRAERRDRFPIARASRRLTPVSTAFARRR